MRGGISHYYLLAVDLNEFRIQFNTYSFVVLSLMKQTTRLAHLTDDVLQNSVLQHSPRLQMSIKSQC